MKQTVHKRFHQMLTVKELENLNTRRLLNVLKIARALESNVLNHYGWRCCNICNEYVGDNWENDVNKHRKHLTAYKLRIKKILRTREHVE